MLDPAVAAGIASSSSRCSRACAAQRADLSFVLPVTAVGYVLAEVLGKVFLHEEVTAIRWLRRFSSSPAWLWWDPPRRTPPKRRARNEVAAGCDHGGGHGVERSAAKLRVEAAANNPSARAASRAWPGWS